MNNPRSNVLTSRTVAYIKKHYINYIKTCDKLQNEREESMSTIIKVKNYMAVSQHALSTYRPCQKQQLYAH